MNSGAKPTGKSVTTVSTDLVQRSDVPPGRKYPEYLEYLRPDFFFSCAYCTLGETEAGGVRYTIDHYEPQSARPDLANDYNNLMYCCNQCNVLKAKRSPTTEQRAKGYRFFRPDQDVYADHFERKGKEIAERTPIGYYSIHAVDLNRESLQRLRDVRDRLHKCDEFVLGGIRALRKFQLDQLPVGFRGKAARTIAEAQAIGAHIVASIDALLAQNMRSFLLDPDQEAKVRSRERAEKLKQLGVRPGSLKAADVLKTGAAQKSRGRSS